MNMNMLTSNANARVVATAEGDIDIESGAQQQQSSDDFFPAGVRASEVPAPFGAMFKVMGWYDRVITNMDTKRTARSGWPVVTFLLYYITMVASS